MADKSTPASAPFPGSRTPGWNDPPTLPYTPHAAAGNASAAAAGRTPRLLNKRVAFPLQNTDTNMNATAKPTAVVPPIVQASLGGLPPPMSLPPAVSSAAGTIQPIAVVHPMPNMNAPLPPPPSAIATPFFVPTLAVESGAAGAAIAAATTATLTAMATTERINVAPRIFVPPHQAESSSRPAAAVQHI